MQYLESLYEALMNDIEEAAASREEQDLHRYEIMSISQKIKQLNDLYSKSKRLGNAMYMERIKERIAVLTDQRNRMIELLDKRQSLEEIDDPIMESVNRQYRKLTSE